MKSTRLALLLTAWLLGSLEPAALAQGGFPFTIRVSQPDQISSVANGGSITVNSTIGTPTNLEIELVYRGSGVVNIPRPVEFAGSTAFALESSSPAPAILQNGSSFRFAVQFLPRVSTLVTSQLTLTYTESVTVGTGTNAVTVTTPGFAQLGLFGTAPEFVVSYILPAEQNFVPVANNGVIPIPTTLVNGTSTVVLSIANRGTGAGRVLNIGSSGDSFSLTGLPLLPLNLPSGGELRVNLRFQPRDAGTLAGLLNIGLNTEAFAARLEGLAVRTLLSYELAQGDRLETLAPASVTSLGEGNPGDTLSAQITIRNGGVFDTAIPSLSLTGQGFGLVEAPATPVALRPGQAVSFFVNFAFAQPGQYRGRLRIGEDLLEFTARVRGSRLLYSYTVGSSNAVTVAPGGTLFFSPLPVGGASDLTLRVRNGGTTPATIISINLADAAGVYRLLDLPTLPLALGVEESLQFRVQFQPRAAGTTNLVLRIDNDSFQLSGTGTGSGGTAPGGLPTYRFNRTSGNVAPLEQPLLALTLNEAFDADLTGELLLTQENISFAADPAVRFSNGQLQAPFRIPAGSREAVFATGARQIRMQTGSVAGDIYVSAQFRQIDGTILTDPNAQLLRLTVAPAAPRLLGFAAATNATGLNLTIAGLVTSRSLRTLDLELKPAPGVNLSNPRLSLNLNAASSLWFGGSASLGFGGSFQMQVPLIFRPAGSNQALPARLVDAVTATLSNEIGASSALEFQLTPLP